MSKSDKPVARDDEKKAADKAPTRLKTRVTAALEQALSQPLEPALYIVSTPIGNLADISLRALSVLERAELVFAEDTRHTRKLTSHFGLSSTLQPYHEHNAARERPRILARIRAGQAVVLVSDAGTPLISDPGYKLARAALDEGLRVISIPGASAMLTALTSSGLASDHFFFEGFLPPKSAARRKRLAALVELPGTLIFYEASSRLVAMLEDARDILGQREAVVMKELTKRHEGSLRGTFEQTVDKLVDKLGNSFAEKGEFVVLAGPPVPVSVADSDIEARLANVMGDRSLRDAARDVAEELGIARGRVYALALKLKQDAGP